MTISGCGRNYFANQNTFFLWDIKKLQIVEQVNFRSFFSVQWFGRGHIVYFGVFRLNRIINKLIKTRVLFWNQIERVLFFSNESARSLLTESKELKSHFMHVL